MTPAEGQGLSAFNAMQRDEAERALLACCSSTTWAGGVAARRPFVDAADLYGAADAELVELSEGDLDDALAGHPRIGERPRGPDGASSRREQSGLDSAHVETLVAIAEGNRRYESRFGHVYLVCATGRTADELLGLLRARLSNDTPTERRIVRDELGKINRIRLGRMLGEEVGI